MVGIMHDYYMMSLMLDVVGQQLRPEWEPTCLCGRRPWLT